MTRYKILLPVILLAFFLRVWQLPQTPPGLWYDEAYYSMDAAWLLDGGPWRIFFVGNNGREPIFIYLQALFIWIFGANPLTSRLANPFIGTLTVATVYVLAHRLLRGSDGSKWLPYVAAAGMAISFWHIGLSRSGYRGILLPLAAALLFYAFWRGWQNKSLKLMVVAGLILGAGQYTYLAARTLPLVFGVFTGVWIFFSQYTGREQWPLSTLGQGLALMALTSALVFAPLGWFFYNNPSLFTARTGDVVFTPNTPAELLTHLSQAIRLFVDYGDPNWRHHLPGRPMLGWLGWLGFWPGLLLCFQNLRRPPYLFLITALLTLYLPALLAVPAVHALRLSAILPLYYLIFALGLTWLMGRVSKWWPAGKRPRLIRSNTRLQIAGLLGVLLLETWLTGYDYFARWASREETYVEYNTPLVDFVHHIVDLTRHTPVIIPFQIYVHPTTRYLLYDQFEEQPAPDNLAGPVQLVNLPDNFRLLNVANIPELPSYAWLERRANGQGVVYISRPPRLAEQEFLRYQIQTLEPQVYRDGFGRELAYFRPIAKAAPLTPMFTHPTPLRAIHLNWANLVELTGYDVTPQLAMPGQPITLNFYWRSLTDFTFDDNLFLQLVDGAGNPVNQWEGEAFREDMYRWRPNGILPTQHTLWLGPDSPPGPYLVRMGFFDPNTGQRLPLQAGECANSACPNSEFEADQTHLGLFYVTKDGTDPRIPAAPLSATFGNAIQLLGVTLPAITNNQLLISNLPVTFHWQALRPTDRPYTVFLQLLNQQGNVVGGWDSQPFGGLYPTNYWSPGEVIADTFELPLPQGGLSPGHYRLITGFYDFETGQRLIVEGGGDFAELAEFEVE